MKKQYMTPETMIQALAVHQMICLSKTIPADEETEVNNIDDLCSRRRRRRNDWEDDWDDEEEVW